jgi:hypothetical protein
MLIPAITLWQPWATLITAGAAPYDFRTWPPPFNLVDQRIAIHAAARRPAQEDLAGFIDRIHMEGPIGGVNPNVALPILQRALASPDILPRASVVGTAVLNRPGKATAFGFKTAPKELWAWPLSDVCRLEPVVPARGARRFWPWTVPPECQKLLASDRQAPIEGAA